MQWKSSFWARLQAAQPARRVLEERALESVRRVLQPRPLESARLPVQPVEVRLAVKRRARRSLAWERLAAKQRARESPAWARLATPQARKPPPRHDWLCLAWPRKHLSPRPALPSAFDRSALPGRRGRSRPGPRTKANRSKNRRAWYCPRTCPAARFGATARMKSEPRLSAIAPMRRWQGKKTFL